MSREGDTIVSLLGHPVTVKDEDGSPVLTIPAGDAARGRLAERTGASAVRLTIDGTDLTLGQIDTDRSARELPRPSAGVYFLVPRLTAFAARHRNDLIFPHPETRNSAGTVDGARGFARYTPAGGRLPRVRAWTRAMAVRVWSGTRKSVVWSRAGGLRRVASRVIAAVARQDWAIGLSFTLANVFMSAAFGWMATTSSPDDRSQWSVALGWLFLVVGLLALALAGVAWRKRGRMRYTAGTAYVVFEQSRDWSRVEHSVFVGSLRSSFESVMEVAGPSMPGMGWSWGYDLESAKLWGANLDRLVWSVLVTLEQSRRDTPNAVFIWAPWPVAVGLAQRLRGLERSLPLRIGRRPTVGRGGEVEDATGPEDCLAFTRQAGASQSTEADLPPETRMHERAYRMTLRLQPDRASMTPVNTREPADPPVSDTRLRLLLVRLGRTPFGEAPYAVGAEPPRADTVRVVDASGDAEVSRVLKRVNGGLVDVRELYLRHATGTHPWHHFPALGSTAMRWIAANALPHDGVTLLAALMPQEVGPGLGLLSHSEHQWPRDLWPLIVESEGIPFVIPSVNLGVRAFGSARVAR